MKKQMKRRVFALLFIIICYCKMHSQIPSEFLMHCAQKEPSNLSLFMTSTLGCSYITDLSRQFDSKFIPTPNYSIHFIQVNLIFLQRNDGSGNFQENNSEHNAILDEIEANINKTYSDMIKVNDPSCYTGTEYILDTRIQFTFDRYYIRYEKGWDNKGSNLCPDGVWYLDSLDNTIVNNVNIKRGINIYFTEWGQNYIDLVVNRTKDTNNSSGMACSQFPSFSNYQRSSRIHSPDCYTKYWHMKNIVPQIYNQPWDPVVKGWYLAMAKGLAHELGHSLWLYHDSPYYGVNTCYYTLMNQGGNNPRDFLPPSEVGRMYASLSLSNIRTFINKNMYNIVPLNVSYKDNWNMEMHLYQDLKINSGGNLTVSCNLGMTKSANVLIKNGGSLIIDGGIINSFSDTWNGSIKVESGGSLIMQNNAVIENCSGGFSVEQGAIFGLLSGEIK